ncbi:MAG: DNA methyltransferase [Phycisphaerales bacterium]
MQQLIEVTTNPRDLVVDPFAGTGSTGVACVKSNRRFYGVEMNGTYARKARQRMAAQRGSS